MPKFIFVTGGVVSGLGKGITAASLGRLLKARGLKIAAQKLDKFYRRHCTFLLENRAGSKAEFERLVGEFFDNILLDMEE